MDSFSPKLPLPKYRAFEALRDQIIEYLLQQKPEIGERFPSVRELMAATSLSQKTVRRAMDQLDREGWIQRQVGVGTFVGPRVNIPVVPHRVRQRPVESWVRMGVLTIMDVERSWYRSPMLDGVEHAAADHHLGAELLISRQAELGRLHERMTRTPPEVMVSLGAADMTGFAIDLAGVLGIPCIVAGTRAADASLPMVREDNGQGIAAAVRHLVEQGHRRIGLVIEKAPFWHNFERRDAYLRGLRQSGIEPHEQLVHWTTLYSDADEDVAAMSAFLRRERPTAVVFATYSAARGRHTLASADVAKTTAVWLSRVL